MKKHMADFKKAVVAFIDNEVVPKCPSSKKVVYVGLGVLSPKLIDRYAERYREILDIAGIVDSDGMVDIDGFDCYFSEVLQKVGGYELYGVRLTSADIHQMAEMARNT